MTANIRTVIFDLDGTLIDTEKYYRIFWPRAAAKMGLTMTDEQALKLRSLGRPFAPQLFAEWYGPEVDYYELRRNRREMMEPFLDEQGIELKKGAKETLARLKELGYTVVLATATPTERAEACLKQVGLYEYFDRICSAVQVERGKPAPDVYLFACNEAGVRPEDAIAVEDSPNGVKSALAAGMHVVMIPDQTPADEDLKPFLMACPEDLTGLLSLLDN